MEEYLDLVGIPYGYFDVLRDDFVFKIAYEGASGDQLHNPAVYIKGKYIDLAEMMKESPLRLFEVVG